jgi:hypothetical protein
MKNILILLLLISYITEAQIKDSDLKNKEWFLKIKENEIFAKDTLYLIRFKKINSSDSKHSKQFAQVCYNNKEEITNILFTKKGVFFSNTTFEFCGTLGNLDSWKYFCDENANEISIENENRKYIYKVKDRILTSESWNCDLQKNIKYTAEIEMITLIKI